MRKSVEKNGWLDEIKSDMNDQGKVWGPGNGWEGKKFVCDASFEKLLGHGYVVTSNVYVSLDG